MKAPVGDQIILENMNEVGGEGKQKKSSSMVHQERSGKPKHGHPLQMCRRQLHHKPVEVKDTVTENDERAEKFIMRIDRFLLQEHKVKHREAKEENGGDQEEGTVAFTQRVVKHKADEAEASDVVHRLRNV